VRHVSSVDGDTFVSTLKPLLERQDLHGLVVTARARWDNAQIVALLTAGHEDARKIALLTLAWVGDKSCIRPLLKQLRDEDEVIHGTAEHALWSIFFRSGTPAANHEVCKGTRLLDAGRFDDAHAAFSRAIALDPTFAEAFNQRAVASYLRENYPKSIDDCDQAIELMPCHFGAWSGKGHALLQLGHLEDAADCYRKALELHPHLGCLKETLEEIQVQIRKVG
jgi:tetratricopeptide (TPR) repeat protein